ncbi:uncharacterized protein [Acropora muricata]|uniref:uncharacterized protein n=1 Tax=Acropora muricata TaxID=159855 RepID=UPI0034E49041
MALVFRVPSYHPTCSPSTRVVPRLRFFDDDDLWRDIALALAQDDRPAFWGRKQSSQGRFKIATIPLNQYKPEEISLDVDPEKITLHGLHRSENENGFENSEFKKVIKMPEGIDPTSVTSTPSEDGRDLLLTGIKRVQENKKDEDKSFAVKLNLSGYKPDEIKVQLRGQELTVTGKQRSEESALQWSRDFHRRILLPDDVDLSSVSSRLSKEGLLTIEAPRDAAFLPSARSLDVTMEEVASQIEDEAKASSNGGEDQNQ